MMEVNDYSEWDNIYQQRDEYIQKHSSKDILEYVKTFIDPQNIERCSQCGVKDNINQCFECINDIRLEK